jgi:GNAT superfamily N-acetyltransferase
MLPTKNHTSSDCHKRTPNNSDGMSPTMFMRPAEEADVAEMVDVMNSAFKDSKLNERCFPPSEPECDEFWAAWVRKNLNDPNSHMLVVVAEPEDDGGRDGAARPPIAGWARWVRREAPPPGATEPPRLVFTPDMYPRCGDGAFAARFFQANYDAFRRIIGREDHWFLSMLVVRYDMQRRGLGALLMRYGVERADREGWPAYVNGSAEGKGLYERYGFRTVEISEFDAITTWHMKREVEREVVKDV